MLAMNQGNLYQPTKFVMGIVGSESIKFTPETEARAKDCIRALLQLDHVTGYSSGHCHLGGIDIWTEEIGDEFGLERFIYPPKTQSWETGYKPRNLQIVKAFDEVHCVTVRELPATYKGMRFDYCYHCHTDQHVRSGGCWTALQAQKRGKPAYWHVI